MHLSSERNIDFLDIDGIIISDPSKKEPAIHAKIERLVIRTGAFRVEGKDLSPGLDAYLKSNAIQSVSLGNEAADRNAYADPLAAQKVFRSGVPIILAPPLNNTGCTGRGIRPESMRRVF